MKMKVVQDIVRMVRESHRLSTDDMVYLGVRLSRHPVSGEWNHERNMIRRELYHCAERFENPIVHRVLQEMVEAIVDKHIPVVEERTW